MQHLIKQLYDCLQEELLYYSTLEEMIRQEQRLVEGFETEAMFDAVDKKEALVAKIKTNEAQRSAIIKQVADCIGCPANRLNITLLLEHLNPSQAALLKDVRDQLKAAIEKVAKETGKLENYISTSLNIYNDTMAYMYQQLSGRHTKIYPGLGAKAGHSKAQSVVVSKRI